MPKMMLTKNEALKNLRLAIEFQVSHDRGADVGKNTSQPRDTVLLDKYTARALYQLARDSSNDSATFDPDSPLVRKRERKPKAKPEKGSIHDQPLGAKVVSEGKDMPATPQDEIPQGSLI